MRISDWSSDVCSSDLLGHLGVQALAHLGSAMVHQHRAVTVHMHQSTRLIEGRHIERNAKLHGCERQPFFKYLTVAVELMHCCTAGFILTGSHQLISQRRQYIAEHRLPVRGGDRKSVV